MFSVVQEIGKGQPAVSNALSSLTRETCTSFSNWRSPINHSAATRTKLGVYDRLIALVPGDGLTQGLRALVAVDWKADLRPYQALIAKLTATDPKKAAEADDINYTICERTPEAYARGLKYYPRNGSVNNAVNYPHAYFEGVVGICEGDLEKARSAFNIARRGSRCGCRARAGFCAGNQFSRND